MADLPRPEWCPAKLWARECQRIRDVHPWLQPLERLPRRYPATLYGEREETGPIVIGWHGTVRPFGASLTEPEIWQLIADLDSKLIPPIGIYKNGSLGHLDGCGVDHAAVRADVRAALTPMLYLDDSFDIEIIYRRSPMFPLVRAVKPLITLAQYVDMPHPLREQEALCVVYPPDMRTWSLEHVGASVFADAAVMYLARHVIWLRLRQRVVEPWLGVAASHRPRDLLRIPLDAPCQCYSGVAFGLCPRRCRERIEKMVEYERLLVGQAIATSEAAWQEAQALGARVRASNTSNPK